MKQNSFFQLLSYTSFKKLVSKRIHLFLFIALPFLVGVDLISKQLVQKLGDPLYNSGISFSLFSKDNLTIVLMVLSIFMGMVCFGGCVYLQKIYKRVEVSRASTTFALLFISAGAFGNGFDRLLNYYKYGEDVSRAFVTDFIYYPGLFTGNIADIYIVLGAVILLFVMLKYKNAEKAK